MPRSRRSEYPLTVSREALLVDGSDDACRRMIHDLVAYAHRLEACRDALASIIGVTGAQFEILFVVARTKGLAVGEVAARLHRSGAFITIEANKLVSSGILDKGSDPSDGRKVLLKPNAKCRALLERLAPYQRRINDALFEGLDARRFRQLRDMAQQLLRSGDRAVALLGYTVHEAKSAA